MFLDVVPPLFLSGKRASPHVEPAALRLPSVGRVAELPVAHPDPSQTRGSSEASSSLWKCPGALLGLWGLVFLCGVCGFEVLADMCSPAAVSDLTPHPVALLNLGIKALLPLSAVACQRTSGAKAPSPASLQPVLMSFATILVCETQQ